MKFDVILIGVQGSGKGTQAQHLADLFGYQIIGTGELLREHVAKHDRIGQLVEKKIIHGELADDVLVNELVIEKMGTISPETPVVFDGYPRNRGQAIFLADWYSQQTRLQPKVVSIDLPRAKVFERVSQRLVCEKCGRIYQYLPELLQDLICPDCHAKLHARKDDQPEILETRLNLFYTHTLPLLEYYTDHHALIRIDGLQSVDEVTDSIVKGLQLNQN